MKDANKPVTWNPEWFYTQVQFNYPENGMVELVFKSSVHSLRNAIILKDLDSLKNIHKQIGDIIKGIEDEDAQ